MDKCLLTLREEFCRVGNFSVVSNRSLYHLQTVDLQSGSRNMTATPNTTVTSPSKRKRYCHPLRPCEPEMVSKAYAKSPLNTPDRLPKMSVKSQSDFPIFLDC